MRLFHWSKELNNMIVTRLFTGFLNRPIAIKEKNVNRSVNICVA